MIPGKLYYVYYLDFEKVTHKMYAYCSLPEFGKPFPSYVYIPLHQPLMFIKDISNGIGIYIQVLYDGKIFYIPKDEQVVKWKEC